MSCDGFPAARTHIAPFNFLAARSSQAGVQFTQNSSTAARFAIFTYFLNALMLHFGNVHQLTNYIKSLKTYNKIVISGRFFKKVCKRVLKCNHASHARKRDSHMHIASTFQFILCKYVKNYVMLG